MIELKEHNKRPYEDLCRMLETHDKCAYVSATGTGKSYVVGKYIEDHNLIDKTLMLVPTIAIKNSWKKLLPGMEIKSYQWLERHEPSLEKYDLMVCDELHHLGAEKWMTAFIKAAVDYHGKIIGMSATPIRYLDHCRDMAEEIFDGNVVEGLNLPSAIDKEVLPSFEYTTALYDLPQRAKKYEDAGTVTDKLFKQLEFMKNEYSFKSILEKTLAKKELKVAVFVSSIAEIPEVTSLVKEVFPEAGHYVTHSGLKRSVIRETIADFTCHSGMAFIYAVDLLNEGVHINGVNAVVMFRKTKSPAVYLQQIGRALSSDNVDEKIKIIDFVANHANLKSYVGNRNSTIQWIREGISFAGRQIIVNDYALDELELLEKLQRLYQGSWTKEEDDILRNNYRKGNVDNLLCLLPGRTRGAICTRAIKMGLGVDIRNTYTDEFYKDLTTLYMEPDGLTKMLEKYPFLTKTTLYKVAANNGVRKLKYCAAPWNDEELEILRNNYKKTAKELTRLLHGRTVCSIRYKRKQLGLRKSENGNGWTHEKEDRFKFLFRQGGLTAVRKSGEFQDLSMRDVYTKARKLDIRSPRGELWEQDKIDRFCALYFKGGRKAVKETSEFEFLTPDMIRNRAILYGAKTEKDQPTKWTDEEMQFIYDYLDTPVEKREPVPEMQKNKLPERTVEAVRKMLRRKSKLRRETANA